MEDNKRVSNVEENEKVGFDVEENEKVGFDVEENEKVGFDVEDEEEEDEETLKKRISCHPLFGLLIEAHLNCLKVCVGEFDEDKEVKEANDNKAIIDVQPTIQSSSELDRFMEAYCITLKKLKQAVEEPLQETVSYTDAMYIQLREITQTTHHHNPKPDPSTR